MNGIFRWCSRTLVQDNFRVYCYLSQIIIGAKTIPILDMKGKTTRFLQFTDGTVPYKGMLGFRRVLGIQTASKPKIKTKDASTS